MAKINKIMACIDLSDYSKMTLEYALELADGTGAEVTLLNVLNKRNFVSVEMLAVHYPVQINMADYIEEFRDERSKEIRQFFEAHFFDQKSKIAIQIKEGLPGLRPIQWRTQTVVFCCAALSVILK